MDEASKMMDVMVQKGCQLNVASFNTMINGYRHTAGLKNLDRAFSLFREMISGGVKPNAVTYNILVDGLCKDGRIRCARLLLTEMQAAGLAPNLVTCASLLDGYAKMVAK